MLDRYAYQGGKDPFGLRYSYYRGDACVVQDSRVPDTGQGRIEGV